MDKISILGCRDEGNGSFTKTWTERNIRSSIRDFAESVNSGKGQLAQFPEEFNIFVLGEIDDVTGQITTISPPKLVTNLKALVRKE